MARIRMILDGAEHNYEAGSVDAFVESVLGGAEKAAKRGAVLFVDGSEEAIAFGVAAPVEEVAPEPESAAPTEEDPVAHG